MKKTFNINMSGRIFTIDEDAYFLLKDYLDTLTHVFNKSDNAEIVTDIESRISEIFHLERNGGQDIITLAYVEAVISRIGKPEEIIETDETILAVEGEKVIDEKVTEIPVPPPFPGNPVPVKKKLFRNSGKGMIGGVCAGISAYLNVDVTWIRLAFIALFIALCYYSIAPVLILYLILWIVLPDARTPIQQLQMNGESPTLYNIGQSVKNTFDRENGNYFNDSADGNKTYESGTNVFWSTLQKILLFLVCVVLISIEVALGLGLLGCIIALLIFGSASGWSVFNPSYFALEATGATILGLLTAIGFIIFFGIPLYLLIRLILKGNDKSPMRRNNRIVLLVTWILGIICAGISCGALITYTNSDDFRNPIDKIRAVNSPNGLVIATEDDETETIIEIDTVVSDEKSVSMTVSNGKDTVINIVAKDYVKEPDISEKSNI